MRRGPSIFWWEKETTRECISHIKKKSKHFLSLAPFCYTCVSFLAMTATLTTTATPSSSSSNSNNNNSTAEEVEQLGITTISSFTANAQAQGWMEVSLLALQDDDDNNNNNNSNNNNNAKQQQQPAASLGERLLLGHSVVLLAPSHNFVTNAQRRQIIADSLQLADATEPTDFETTGRRRLPTIEAANRAAAATANTECGTPLDEATNDLVQTCYQRIAAYLDQTWPEAIQVLFGNDDDDDDDDDDSDNEKVMTSLSTLMQTDQLQYASREPAINIYRAPGGAFDAHQDDETLTALICLSVPEHDFQGGGTVFWEPKKCSSSAAPVVMIRPPAGTVMLFGGTVTHAACAVTAGCRVMAVSSFGKKQQEEEDEPTSYLY